MGKFLNILCISIMFLGGLYGQDRPNILWVTIEDTSPQFIGAYGNRDARTPIIDQLAQQGVRFMNAFSTGTVCSPSRSTIITGVPTYKMGTGHHRSSVRIPDFIKGFPYVLKQQGYYTSNNAKTDYNLARPLGMKVPIPQVGGIKRRGSLFSRSLILTSRTSPEPCPCRITGM